MDCELAKQTQEAIVLLLPYGEKISSISFYALFNTALDFCSFFAVVLQKRKLERQNALSLFSVTSTATVPDS